MKAEDDDEREEVKREEEEQNGKQLVYFQLETGENPLYSFYRQICYDQPGADRYALVCLLAADLGIWPKKVRTKETRQGIESGPGELLLEFFVEVFDKIAPRYQEWTTIRVEKKELSFLDFVATLDDFYANIKRETSKDGRHYMRKGTGQYRAKHELKKATFEAGRDGKSYPPYYDWIAAGGYPFAPQPIPNPTDDDIQIDHVLSCQVFSAMLKKCPSTYSFDRYYSLKTWLNKCWNFIAVPAKVNGRKGHLEKKIIDLISSDKCIVRRNRTVYWVGLSQDEEKVLRDYFGLVGDTIQTYAKKDFLDQRAHDQITMCAILQMKDVKSFVCKFLESLGAVVDVESMRGSYECKGCFCLKDNQSKRERIQTYHLFCTIELPGVLHGFTEVTVELLQRARQARDAKPLTKLERLDAGYKELQEEKKQGRK